jgi:hypothetical protein
MASRVTVSIENGAVATKPYSVLTCGYLLGTVQKSDIVLWAASRTTQLEAAELVGPAHKQQQQWHFLMVSLMYCS